MFACVHVYVVYLTWLVIFVAGKISVGLLKAHVNNMTFAFWQWSLIPFCFMERAQIVKVFVGKRLTVHVFSQTTCTACVHGSLTFLLSRPFILEFSSNGRFPFFYTGGHFEAHPSLHRKYNYYSLFRKVWITLFCPIKKRQMYHWNLCTFASEMLF